MPANRYSHWWRTNAGTGKTNCQLPSSNPSGPTTRSSARCSRKQLDWSSSYLTNNADRMRYDEYRKKGLPITTSRVESTQKQINGRVKGTEKFWNDESLEPVLQLVSDDLSDNFDPEAFWNRRQQRFNGYRERSPDARPKQ